MSHRVAFGEDNRYDASIIPPEESSMLMSNFIKTPTYNASFIEWKCISMFTKITLYIARMEWTLIHLLSSIKCIFISECISKEETADYIGQNTIYVTTSLCVGVCNIISVISDDVKEVLLTIYVYIQFHKHESDVLITNEYWMAPNYSYFCLVKRCKHLPLIANPCFTQSYPWQITVLWIVSVLGSRVILQQIVTDIIDFP